MKSADLKREAHELGFDLVGVCDAVAPPHLAAYRTWLAKGYHGVMGYMERQAPLREHPERLLFGARSIVAVGLNYNQPNPVRAGYPHIARYALGRDYHKVLRGKLRALGRRIESALPGVRWRVCVDSAPIFERDYARLAGLGWFGKNTCLINSRHGSWFVLGLLLTSERFEPDEPAVGDCGTCRLCVDACPTGAIVHEEARRQVDSRKCISYLTIEVPAAGRDAGRKAYGVGAEEESPSPTPYAKPSTPSAQAETPSNWTFGCDVCQEVCPFNQVRQSQPLRAAPTREPDFTARREWPSLIELAQISHDSWDRLTRGSAVRRAGWEGLKRNAEQNLSSLP